MGNSEGKIAFEGASGGGSAEVVVVDSTEVSVAVKEAIAKAGERMDVSDAEIVISGGRGWASLLTSRTQ